MAGPDLPEAIFKGDSGHVEHHEKIHELLNVLDEAEQVQATGDLLVFQNGLLARLPVGPNGSVLTADSGEDAGLKWD